ncbi:MAG: glycosyltransferase family 2 protein [Planctomycetota bacterium]
MFGRLRIAVTVPAYDEERLIGRTLAGIPPFVDRVIVVDDASRDGTVAAIVAAGRLDPRIELVARERNGGVGAAIKSGYRRFLETGDDVCVVMAGDAQMDPSDLEALLAPIASGRADYAKGDRLSVPGVSRVMPRDRLLGNHVFTAMTKWASGYWHVIDSQCGYTAITRAAVEAIDLERVYDRYGVPNDLLIRLNVARQRVADVPVRPIYGEEVSGIRPLTTVPRIGALLLRGFLRRMWSRHVRREPHAVVLLYALGFAALVAAGIGGVWRLVARLAEAPASAPGPGLLLAATGLGLVGLALAVLCDRRLNAELRAGA